MDLNESHHARRIEELLADMPLAQPSTALDDRVLGWAACDRRRWRLVGLTSGLTGLAAGLAIALAIWGVMELTHEPAAGPAGDPVARNNATHIHEIATGDQNLDDDFETAYQATDTQLFDEGLVVNADRMPVHRIRRVTTHQVMYFNAKTNEQLEVTVPQEELIFIAAEPF
jgi:hypothetical protein